MIKAKLTANSHDRTEAIRFLLRKVKIDKADGWEKIADVTVTSKVNGGITYVATTTVATDEARFEE